MLVKPGITWCASWGRQMTDTTFYFIEETQTDRRAFQPLLLEGDGDSAILAQYIATGRLFSLRRAADNALCAVALLTNGPDAATVELKNIAVAAELRGQGLGSMLIRHLQTWAAAHYHKMLVGTGDADVQNQLFYLKNGFRYSGVRRDFFAAYQPPIRSNGLILRDMVLLTAEL